MLSAIESPCWAVCDRIAVLAENRVLVVGPMAEMLRVTHPWVHEYFHGPRARAAQDTMAAGAGNDGPGNDSVPAMAD